MMFRLVARLFLSTLSLRRATTRSQPSKPKDLFLSTLSLRRATIVGGAGNNTIRISIHALLAESDLGRGAAVQRMSKFLSTLSLRRATREPTALRTPHHIFLSTLSLRRATIPPQRSANCNCHFYPRSPCGERQSDRKRGASELRISIHALLAESDNECTSLAPNPKTFLSTLSLRRATEEENQH